MEGKKQGMEEGGRKERQKVVGYEGGKKEEGREERRKAGGQRCG